MQKYITILTPAVLVMHKQVWSLAFDILMWSIWEGLSYPALGWKWKNNAWLEERRTTWVFQFSFHILSEQSEQCFSFLWALIYNCVSQSSSSKRQSCLTFRFVLYCTVRVSFIFFIMPGAGSYKTQAFQFMSEPFPWDIILFYCLPIQVWAFLIKEILCTINT